MGEESRLKGMPKISNITNASDPASIGSRVFVGNLNTFTLTKDDVENVFKRYGKIQGISMHKGYAFVQYANEFDARNSVAGEDQRIYAGQPLDVNMAAEPKPNRQSRKRNITTEWDCFFDAPLVQPTRTILPQVTPPVKRTRTELSPALVKRSLVALPPGTPLATAQLARLIQPATFPIRKTSPAPCHNNKKRESSLSPRLPSPPVLSDILICGNCRQLFVDVESLTEHKKVPCRLRFADETDEPKCLACVNCNAIFHSCWNLLQHAQAEHDTNIYCIVNSNNDSNDREEVTEENDKQSSLENGHDEIEPETEDKRDNESDVTEENGDKSCDI